MSGAGTPIRISAIVASDSSDGVVGRPVRRPASGSRAMCVSSARSGAADAAIRLRDARRLAVRFEEGLAQVDQVALGQPLDRAAHVLDRDRDARERIARRGRRRSRRGCVAYSSGKMSTVRRSSSGESSSGTDGAAVVPALGQRQARRSDRGRSRSCTSAHEWTDPSPWLPGIGDERERAAGPKMPSRSRAEAVDRALLRLRRNAASPIIVGRATIVLFS